MAGIPAILRMAILLMATVWFAGCQDQHGWYQKLTVVVDTPAGEISGSSIVEVRARFRQLPLSNSEVNYSVAGEAIALEIEPGRYLFALLGGDEERYYRAVREKIGNRNREEWLNLIPKMDEVVTLRPENYPRLVTFHDNDDPKSISRVNPVELADHFGDQISLKTVTLEITEAPITRGLIASVLPWLCDYKNRQVSLGNRTGPISDNELYNNTGTGAFKIGDCG